MTQQQSLTKNRTLYHKFKRVVDFGLALGAMILLSPVLLITAVLVRVSSGAPVLFSQERLGMHGKLFRLYKFRSMTNNPTRTINQQVHEGHPEVTRIGRVLRRTKLDELPQLWNVVRGDLALVGPRPTLPEQLAGYTPRQRRRLEVRGGLTCLAQIKGSSYLSWDERIEYDLEYVERESVWLDSKIVLLTGLVILLGERRFLKHPDMNRQCA